MKKFLAAALCALMVLAVCVPVFASDVEAIKPYGIAGQDINAIGKATTTAPVADGVVNDGEYSWTKTWLPTDAGLKNTLSNPAALGYVTAAMSYDADKIYVAFVVQEDEYTKKGSTYSQLVMHIGFKKDANVDAAMSRFTTTLSINAADDTVFSGDNYLDFKGNNFFYSDWGYMNTLETAEKYVRGTDKDGKAITIYELALDKAVIKKAFGLEELGNWCYFAWEAKPTVGGASVGALEYKNFLDDDTKAEYIFCNGWCPSFFPHIVYFGEAAATYELDGPKYTIGNFNAADPKPYALLDKGQDINYVGAPIEKAPVVDGVLSADEYSFVKTFKNGEAGTVNKDLATIGYGKLGVAYDRDYVYLAGVAQEDNHTVGTNKYCFNFSFENGGKLNDMMSRVMVTCRMDAEGAQFAGTGFYQYSGNGTLNGTKWTWHNGSEETCRTNENMLVAERKYARGTDADGKAITTYEIKLRKSVLRQIFGADALDNFGYISCELTDANDKVATHYAVPTTDVADAFKANNGWCPSFTQHLLILGEKPEDPGTGDNTAFAAMITVSIVALLGTGVTTFAIVYKKRKEN